MKRVFIYITGIIILTSCFRLDDNLYNANSDITAYLLDEYDGEQDFVLGSAYKIPDNLVSIFTLESKLPSESSSTSIYAIYIGDINTISTDTVIMYCHGNKWHMDYYWQRAKLMAHAGGKNNYGVLMIDYRGYGLSEGKSTEEGLYADVDAGLAWLKSEGLTDDRLVIYGFSMGTAPACKLTGTPRTLTPSKLILEAPFASAEAMVQGASVLSLPSSFVTNLSINNAEEIKKVSEPFLWLHGTADDRNGFKDHGEVVYKNYKGTYKESIVINNGGHSDLPSLIGYQAYCEKLDQFIKR
jgi:fermentation-respiration switch protein FrsA (DUF1100 family)